MGYKLAKASAARAAARAGVNHLTHLRHLHPASSSPPAPSSSGPASYSSLPYFLLTLQIAISYSLHFTLHSLLYSSLTLSTHVFSVSVTSQCALHLLALPAVHSSLFFLSLSPFFFVLQLTAVPLSVALLGPLSLSLSMNCALADHCAAREATYKRRYPLTRRETVSTGKNTETQRERERKSLATVRREQI